MKIKSIKLENNEVFGDLFLDFTNENNEVVDTIIFAGENGSGKTTILEIIYEFSRFRPDKNIRDEKREFKIELTDKEIEVLEESEKTKEYFDDRIENNELKIKFDFNLEKHNQVEINFQGNNQEIPPHIFDNNSILRAIFSDAKINFDPKAINSVTSQDIDRNIISSVRSDSSLATQITQLLIDIQALDDADFAEWGRNNLGEPVDEDLIDLRMNRFKRAFDFMFSNKKYKRVKNENNKKRVIFEEGGTEIPIRNLSSGEKQIVFRGSFLLKDQKNNEGSLVLIDEPEISLHPRWQLKILEFYRRLFTNEKGEQTSQIFTATHSPFIIHNEHRRNDKVIILDKDSNGNVNAKNNGKFYGWKPKGTIKNAFKIDWNFNFDVPVVLVEGETDEAYFKTAKKVLNREEIEVKIKWVGRFNEQGNVEFTGDSALNKVKSFMLANQDLLNQKVILLYDSDTNKPSENFDKLFIRSMLENKENVIFNKGVENLLYLPNDFPKDKFYKENTHTKKTDYSGEKIIKERTLDKKKLCNWICNETSKKEKEIYFKNFEKMFDMIEEIIFNR